MIRQNLKWTRYEVSQNDSERLKEFVPTNLEESESVTFDVPDLSHFADVREQAIYLLHTTAEIEHALLVQYLYAAYSLGQPFAGNEIPGDAVSRTSSWRAALLKIAREEMGHFLTVQNLLRFINAPLNFDREDFPFNQELYPFHFTLEPLSRRSLAKYIAAEMPAKIADVPELQEILELAKDAVGGAAVNRVGVLYALLFSIFSEPKDSENLTQSKDSWNLWANIVQSATAELSKTESLHLRDEDFHPETELHQAAWEDWGGEESIIVRRVTNREQALEAIRAIAEQGEGVSTETAPADSHFARFLSIYREFPDEKRWIPTRDVPKNPEFSDDPQNEAAITNRRSQAWAELLNLRYQLLLTSLAHFLYNDEPLFVAEGERKGDRTAGGLLHLWAFDEMRRIGKIADKLATMPRGSPKKSPRAGAPFKMPESLAVSEKESERWNLQRELRLASAKLIETLRSGDARDNDDSFLKFLSAADVEATAVAEAKIKGATPKQASGFVKVLKILDEAVHGFAVRGAHGSFWAGQSLRQLATRSFYNMPFLTSGNALKSRIYRALEGLTPFGSDIGTPDAIWQRMPVGRPPVHHSRREFIKEWIDNLPADDSFPDEDGLLIEPNPLAEPLPVPTIDGGDVVIIGAGLAGLAAAVDLMAKGLKVTVLEKAHQVGGKTMAWRDGDKETVEHGMHGWWSQYFN